MGLLGVSDETFHLLRRFIANRFYPHHMPGFTRALLNKPLRAGGAFAFRHGIEQIGSDEYAIGSALRGYKNDARSLRLIAEPLSRRRKNENKDESDHEVILPRRARKIPKNQPPAEAARRCALFSRVFRHLPSF